MQLREMYYQYHQYIDDQIYFFIDSADLFLSDFFLNTNDLTNDYVDIMTIVGDMIWFILSQ